MPRHDAPFTKWDEPPHEEEPHHWRGPGDGENPTTKGQTPIVKMWLLRLAWVISTGMLVVGAGLIILILSGYGGVIGL